MAGEDLDSIFDDKAQAQTSADAQPEQASPEPVASSEPETGDKQQEAAPPADPRQEDANAGPLVPRRALEDERKKRQEYERRFAELERKLQDMQTPPKQPEPPQAPNVWEDPEGALAFQQQTIQQTFARQMYETRVSLGTEIVKAQHPDYDDVVADFVAQAQVDPALRNAVLQHPNPAAFAYSEGRKIRFLKEVGNDPDAYKARLREEFMAEQSSGQIASRTQPAAAPPKSLAATTSAQPRNSRGQYASGPASLDDILGG